MKRGCIVRMESLLKVGIQRGKSCGRSQWFSQIQDSELWRVFCLFILVLLITQGAAGAGTIKIGALLAFNSSIGQVALRALQLAVDDVNNDQNVLPEHQLVIQMSDSNCTAFQGVAAAMDLMRMEVVAIAGPQTSEVAQFVTDMAIAGQVPLVSYSATDPSLTMVSRPKSFFSRTIDSDEVQMLAIANLVNLYGWRDVVAISTQDGVGVNGINALERALKKRGSSIIYRALVDPSANQMDLATVLSKLQQLRSRVYVVHLEANVGRLFVSMANSMQMVALGYVWIVTESLAVMLDNLAPQDVLLQDTQGIIGVRAFVPKSAKLDTLTDQWNSQTGAPPLTVYGLRAYDSVWMIAHAVQGFLSEGGNFSFVPRAPFPKISGGNSQLASLKVLDTGSRFMEVLLSLNFSGVSGFVQDGSQKDSTTTSVYEVVNMVGKGLRTVGYWYNQTFFSQAAPLVYSNTSERPSASDSGSIIRLQDIIWPGGIAQVPRGWVVPEDGKMLLVGVPQKIGYTEFVETVSDVNNITTFRGFSIDAFNAAITYLPYPVTYKYVKFGDGIETPNYDDLINAVVDQVFDAAVGDITITSKRTKLVDFSQPYSTSGLVVLAPVKKGGSSHAWSFMRPFTAIMWCTTGLFFLLSKAVISILEHRKNEGKPDRPKKALVPTLWSVVSNLLLTEVDNVRSTLARVVLIIWLFVALIIMSSYTAGLTSIITAQQLMPTIQGIAGLLRSKALIGYQRGSFVKEYLLQLNVDEKRLVALDTLTSYDSALRTGTVAAIVDEMQYVQQLLSVDCEFAIVGQEFTQSDWGFAFPKGSQLAVDLSNALLALSENGKLQQIHDYWLSHEVCSADGVLVPANELGVSTFWGLFLITGAASVLSIILHYIRVALQHQTTLVSENQPASDSSIGKRFLRSMAAYLAVIDAHEDAKSIRFVRKVKRKRSSSPEV